MVGQEGGTVCCALEMFTAIRLGLILTMARFGLLYRSEKLSILSKSILKKKKANLVLGLEYGMVRSLYNTI